MSVFRCSSRALPPPCSAGWTACLARCWAPIAIGLIESLAGGYIGSGFIDVSAFLVIMAVLLIRPRGLLGSAALRRA